MSTEFSPKDKLLLQGSRLAAFERGDTSAPPALVEISPTNSCNAKCPWCFYVSSEYKQAHSHEEINADVLKCAIGDLAAMGVPAISWTGGGDPSTYCSINDAISFASDMGLKQGMFTNGYKPIERPELLAWIRITVTERFVITKHVAKYAEKTKVGVNFNLCTENECHVLKMAEDARSAGVRYFQVRPALADRVELQQSVSMPSFLKDLETDTFRVVLTGYKFADYLAPHGYSTCFGHHFTPFIWHNGDVSVCAYHFGKQPYTFGNLNQERFFQIWRGERRRSMVETGIAVIPECQHCCKNHETNKVLASIRGELERPQDEAFI